MDEQWSMHLFSPLIKEIDKLKQTLCDLDADDSTISTRIEEHARKIQETIPPNAGIISCVVEVPPPAGFRPKHPHHICCPYPLCRLLNKENFCPKEIPLSIVEFLVMAGFDVNRTYSEEGQTCLHSAIDSGHYNAVRWLVEHGADCNAKGNGQTCLPSAIYIAHYNAVGLEVEHDDDSNAMNPNKFHHKTPIVSLASRPNVPQDLFDLLKTPENLNDGRNKRLPLHEALRHGCINSVLYLISLGPEVNNIDGYYECLPIECYIGWASEYHVQE